jgi:YVTN family beta-propeller protein
MAATSTLAVIKTITIGSGGAYGVAVNQVDDTVYVTNYYFASNTVSVINGRTGTVSGTIPVGTNPIGVAVNEGDDTVYVANYGSNNVSVINGRTATVAGTITVGNSPRSVAVDQGDDTVYVPNGGSNNVSVINGRLGALTDDTIPVGDSPRGVAVDEGDDTVYVPNNTDSNVSVINGRTATVAGTITVGSNPRSVAVNEGDDTVYVPNFASNTVSVINGRTGTVSGTIPDVSRSFSVAVDQGDDTVYVANYSSDKVSVINGRTATVSGTITVGDGPVGVAVDGSGTNAGLVYVTNLDSNTVSVIGRVTPSLGSASGSAGSSLSMTLDVPQVAYDVDDSTITSVSFDDTPATGLTPVAGDAWTLTVPAGTGTVPVTVTFKGGLTASAGTFTYGSTPGPNPPAPTPASAPLDVTATAGDASATVTWKAPASPGSYPITTYQAISTPPGRTCLASAPALTCAVTGLTNGTAYTFTIHALTGAGWGTTSSPSNTVTPRAVPKPSITITGTRDGERIMVTGTTTGFATGAILRPWTRFPGQTSHTQGTASILVDAQGGFTWERRTGKTIYILIRSQDGTVESNRLILRTT